MSIKSIDSLANNPYKNWIVHSEEKKLSATGSTYYELMLVGEPKLRLRFARIFLLVVSLTGSLGLAALSKKFRISLQRSVQTKWTKIIHSQEGLEKYFLRRLQGAPSAEKLYQKAVDARRQISFQFVKKEALEFDADSDHQGRIRIRYGTNSQEKMFSFALFELANCSHDKAFWKTHFKVLSGEIRDAEIYTKRMEKTEYKSMRLHHEVITQAIQSNGWNKKLDLYGGWFNRGMSFEEYWKHQQKTPHAAYYRRAFKPIFENQQKTSSLAAKVLLYS